MKTKLILSIFSFALLFSACKKENNTTINGNSPSSPCQTNNTCEIKFTNANSTNPYNCYVNGNYVFQINGNGGTNTATVTAGSLSLKSVQASGYVFTPTVYTSNLSVGQCSSGSWQF